jgi:hypothetical protein
LKEIKKKESKYKSGLSRTVYFSTETERDAFVNLAKDMRLNTGDCIVHLMKKARYKV